MRSISFYGNAILPSGGLGDGHLIRSRHESKRLATQRVLPENQHRCHYSVPFREGRHLSARLAWSRLCSYQEEQRLSARKDANTDSGKDAEHASQDGSRQDEQETKNIQEYAAAMARRRDVREKGMLAGCTMTGLALIMLAIDNWSRLSSNRQLSTGTALLGTILVAASVIPRISDWGLHIGDLCFIECYNGRIYLQPGAPPEGGLISPGDVIVRETGDRRGRGAYAAVDIPKDTWLIQYSGDLLDDEAFYTRYPDGVCDYGMALDADTIVDAFGLCNNGTDEFAAGHVNHSRKRSNLKRWYDRRQQSIWYYVAQDVSAGEELLIDYGRGYWKGREHLEME